MKRKIRLTESDLHRIVKTSVKRIIKEITDDDDIDMMFDPVEYRNKKYPQGKEGDNAFSWDKYDNILTNKSTPKMVDSAFKKISGRKDEIDWLRNGKKAKEDWISGKMVPKNKPFPIFADGFGENRGFEMPGFCYAHGKLESDMGYDLFFMPEEILNRISDETADGYGCQIKIGSYACTFNGKPCTIYSGVHDHSMRRAFCCYNDDEEAKEFIARYLNLIPNY